jgi:hypothetical protein
LSCRVERDYLRRNLLDNIGDRPQGAFAAVAAWVAVAQFKRFILAGESPQRDARGGATAVSEL